MESQAHHLFHGADVVDVRQPFQAQIYHHSHDEVRVYVLDEKILVGNSVEFGLRKFDIGIVDVGDIEDFFHIHETEVLL